MTLILRHVWCRWNSRHPFLCRCEHWGGVEEFGHGLLWAALVTGAEPSPRGGHPRTLDADVHAQVTGIDLNTLSSQPEEPEAGTHAQTSGAEPDPLVGQPDGPNQGEDAHLANAYSEGLMGALEDWLVEVEEVEVEAADETVRVEEGAGPRVDP
jgi:hypothetical protein